MAFDENQLLRNAATTATFTGTGIRVRSLPLDGIPIRVVVPSATGTSPTMDLKVQDSADDSTYNDVFTFRQITAAGVYRARVQTQREYIRLVGTVGGTSPNFGTVKAGLETGGQFDNRQSQ